MQEDLYMHIYTPKNEQIKNVTKSTFYISGSRKMILYFLDQRCQEDVFWDALITLEKCTFSFSQGYKNIRTWIDYKTYYRKMLATNASLRCKLKESIFPLFTKKNKKMGISSKRIQSICILYTSRLKNYTNYNDININPNYLLLDINEFRRS